ncbi:MAG: hypothetical protein P1U56_23895 [Saprospiraceae bacterium]|nr:hypothetical protein [Saprospiraceae bacterium]
MSSEKLFFILFVSLFLLFKANNLYGQPSPNIDDKSDVIYYKDKSILKGNIEIDEEDEFVIFFSEDKPNKQLIISPKDILFFIEWGDDKKRVIESKEIGSNQFLFLENIYEEKGNKLYLSLDKNRKFLELSNGEIQLIHKENPQRSDQFKRLLPVTSSIGSRRIWAKGKGSVKRLINNIAYPSYRYPGYYSGMKFTYSAIEIDQVTSSESLKNLFPEKGSNIFDRFGVELYITNTENKKSSLASNLSLGIEVMQSNEYHEEVSPTSFSIRGISLTSSLRVNYYFPINKFFPYVTLGGKASYLLDEDGIIVTSYLFETDKTRIDHFSMDLFSSFYWTPKIGLGIEIPIKNARFLFLEGCAESMTDKVNERSIFYSFSIGINII